MYVIPKKGGLIIIKNEKGESVAKQLETGWRMCIDYRKLNKATRKDHFPLLFIDQMLEHLARHSYFCYLDSYSGFFSKFQFIQMTKRKLLSHVPMELSPTDECHLDYAMFLQPSNDV